MLADAGADVTTAGSAAEAFASLNDAPFDVLIGDIGMPIADGYDLIQQVRGATSRHAVALLMESPRLPGV